MNKKWTKSALNCEAYFSFEGVSSDHRIVTAKIRLSLGRNASQTTRTACYGGSMLINRDISDKYTITQGNKFDALQEISETLTPTKSALNCEAYFSFEGVSSDHRIVTAKIRLNQMDKELYPPFPQEGWPRNCQELPR